MKKRVVGYKLSRTTNERKQLFRNLTRSLAEHGSIVTSLAKAKAAKRFVEKLITWAKKNNLTSFRYLVAKTNDLATARILTNIAKHFQQRNGGYTRLIRLGRQKGDNSLKVRLEWVEKVVDSQKTRNNQQTASKIQRQ